MNVGTDQTPGPGAVIAGKYVVERTIGIGGMGVVLAAMHRQLDQRVAIKCLLPELLGQKEVVARFLREAQAATKIRSEHVVRVLDVGELHNGAPFMVLEYLEGKDLDGLLRASGPLSVVNAVDYVTQALEALAEAHALGMVHRDLKPANLFLTHRADGSACVKVLDFGISKVAARPGEGTNMNLTNAAAVMGSPHYMAPEQMRSARDVDARADVWALGAILHEVLAGGPPFRGQTFPELFAQILQDSPPPLSMYRNDVPVALDQTILRAMEKDPARRFANVAELAFAIAPYGSPAAQASAERIARVLQIAPPSFLGNAQTQGVSEMGNARTLSVPPQSALGVPSQTGGGSVYPQRASMHSYPGVPGRTGPGVPGRTDAGMTVSPAKATSKKWLIALPLVAGLIGAAAIGAVVVRNKHQSAASGLESASSSGAGGGSASVNTASASASSNGWSAVAAPSGAVASSPATSADSPADAPAPIAASDPLLPPAKSGARKSNNSRGSGDSSKGQTGTSAQGGSTASGGAGASGSSGGTPAGNAGTAGAGSAGAGTAGTAGTAGVTAASSQPVAQKPAQGQSQNGGVVNNVGRDVNNAGRDVSQSLNKLFR